MCQNELYQQINGSTMLGSPLGPILANLFKGNLETKLLNELQTSKPKLIYDNVDDVFAIFDDQQVCSSFFRQLNAQHSHTKFTAELSTLYLLIFEP